MAGDKMQRVGDETHTQIGELVTLFAGLPNVTRQSVNAAAVRVFLTYIKTWQRQGQDLERIWRDVAGGGA